MNQKKFQANKKSLVIVYTGNGKGKTTAALGMAIRACGYDWKVVILQFIKGSWTYGEERGVKLLSPNVELKKLGKGFYKIMNDKLPEAEHKKAVEEALEIYDLVILDEINVAVSVGLLKPEDVLGLIQHKAEKTHLVLTGRDAHATVIEAADLCTEMKEIKHPFQKGFLAQKGIDY
ncbi:MAG: cob(I)yrinic acid a,c-diamide adenosyltransferase [Deltaproteobacteria bacterium]|nr:cob(I)yrinic acid a,c-diamide adenosyltransferase [Deltaproteobacteria bacterium]